MQKKDGNHKNIRFQSYAPKLTIPKRFLDMIDDVEISQDGQVISELPWLTDLKNSVKEHPENQLILDAMGSFAHNVGKGEQSRIEMMMKVIEKSEEHMKLASQENGSSGQSLEEKVAEVFKNIQEGNVSEYQDIDESNSLLQGSNQQTTGLEINKKNDRFIGVEHKYNKKNEEQTLFNNEFRKGHFIPQTELHEQRMKSFTQNNEFWIGDNKISGSNPAMDLLKISGETEPDRLVNISQGLDIFHSSQKKGDFSYSNMNQFLSQDMVQGLIQSQITFAMIKTQLVQSSHYFVDFIYYALIQKLFVNGLVDVDDADRGKANFFVRFYFEILVLNLLLCLYMPLRHYFKVCGDVSKSTLDQVQEANFHFTRQITAPSLLQNLIKIYKKCYNLLLACSITNAKTTLILLLMHFSLIKPDFMIQCLLSQILFSLIRIFSIVKSHMIFIQTVILEIIMAIVLLIFMYKYGGFSEINQSLVVVLVHSWNFYKMIKKYETLKKNLEYVKKPFCLHLDTEVSQLGKIMIIPNLIQSARIQYLESLAITNAGVRVI